VDAFSTLLEESRRRLDGTNGDESGDSFVARAARLCGSIDVEYDLARRSYG